jgi:hypothetical protein
MQGIQDIDREVDIQSVNDCINSIQYVYSYRHFGI